MASPTVAANAYAALSRIVESGGAEKGSQSAGGPSFSAVLKDARRQRDGSGQEIRRPDHGDESGKANVMDVVTAVAETDVAVSTLVSVRDRVIQSYEDIMRMPI